MSHSIAPIIGVSSWALHQELGKPPFYGAESDQLIPDFTPDAAKLTLLEMPAELARQSFDAMQICHFHLPTHDESYLYELKDAIQSAGISLHAFLVDEGDVTHPENGARDAAWMKDWIPVAAALGAQHIRFIAGKTNRSGAIEHSAQVLKSLATQAVQQGLEVLIENWFELLATPTAVHELLERCEGQAKLQLDFSNWNGTTKYEDLTAIAPLATCCHAQARFVDAKQIDEADYNRCLNLPYPTGFNGPFILVNGGLEGIGVLRDYIKNHYNNGLAK